jgi:hypothetical protein
MGHCNRVIATILKKNSVPLYSQISYFHTIFQIFLSCGDVKFSFASYWMPFIVLLLCGLVKCCPVSEAKRMFFIIAYICLPQKCLITLKGTEKAE